MGGGGYACKSGGRGRKVLLNKTGWRASKRFTSYIFSGCFHSPLSPIQRKAKWTSLTDPWFPPSPDPHTTPRTLAPFPAPPWPQPPQFSLYLFTPLFHPIGKGKQSLCFPVFNLLLHAIVQSVFSLNLMRIELLSSSVSVSKALSLVFAISSLLG